MFERFKRNDAPERASDGGVATADRPVEDDPDWAAGRTRTMRDGTVVEDDRTLDHDRTVVDDRTLDDDRTVVDDRTPAERDVDARTGTATTATGALVGGTEAMRSMRARQRERFGGFNWGAAFFGWLVAVGVAALLVGLLAGAGASVGLSKTNGVPNSTAEITLGGGIALLVALLIAYFSGGYVAGRMSRFDGARQGIGVWLFGLLVTVALAVLAVAAGPDYNVLERLDLPRLPTGDETLTTGGVIALAAIVVGTLLAAALGGKAGERYHRRVDRAGFVG
jgi:hypothetical protein